MKHSNNRVDKYLLDGCMRCKLGGTPACKVNNWRTELEILRNLVLECDLTEELKWSFPCYTFENKNIVMVSAFKDYACLSFFKGVLLKDTQHILSTHGENSQSARIMKFTSPEQIIEKKELIKLYIAEAIEIEKSGQKVEFTQKQTIPEELQQKFEDYPQFEKAFYTLTPGRQRGYLLYFSQPKQPEARLRRIEKYESRIMAGKGLQDV